MMPVRVARDPQEDGAEEGPPEASVTVGIILLRNVQDPPRGGLPLKPRLVRAPCQAQFPGKTPRRKNQ